MALFQEYLKEVHEAIQTSPSHFEEYMPKTYFSGLSPSTIAKRKTWFRKKIEKYRSGDMSVFDEKGPGQSKKPRRRSDATIKVNKMMNESAADSSIREKAKKFKIPFRILKEVYRRGVGAWTSGHRPGVGPEQWGHARVNAFIAKGKTYRTADSDLAKKLQALKKK